LIEIGRIKEEYFFCGGEEVIFLSPKEESFYIETSRLWGRGHCSKEPELGKKVSVPY